MWLVRARSRWSVISSHRADATWTSLDHSTFFSLKDYLSLLRITPFFFIFRSVVSCDPNTGCSTNVTEFSRTELFLLIDKTNQMTVNNCVDNGLG